VALTGSISGASQPPEASELLLTQMAGSHSLNAVVRRHSSTAQELENKRGCAERRQNVPEYLETPPVACHLLWRYLLVPPLGKANARQPPSERPDTEKEAKVVFHGALTPNN